ncbi:hypothetical protein [Nostoc sp.]
MNQHLQTATGTSEVVQRTILKDTLDAIASSGRIYRSAYKICVK